LCYKSSIQFLFSAISIGIIILQGDYIMINFLKSLFGSTEPVAQPAPYKVEVAPVAVAETPAPAKTPAKKAPAVKAVVKKAPAKAPAKKAPAKAVAKPKTTAKAKPVAKKAPAKATAVKKTK